MKHQTLVLACCIAAACTYNEYKNYYTTPEEGTIGGSDAGSRIVELAPDDVNEGLLADLEPGCAVITSVTSSLEELDAEQIRTVAASLRQSCWSLFLPKGMRQAVHLQPFGGKRPFATRHAIFPFLEW